MKFCNFITVETLMEIGYKSEKYLHYIMRKIIKRFKVGPKKQQVKLKKLFFIEF